MTIYSLIPEKLVIKEVSTLPFHPRSVVLPSSGNLMNEFLIGFKYGTTFVSFKLRLHLLLIAFLWIGVKKVSFYNCQKQLDIIFRRNRASAASYARKSRGEQTLAIFPPITQSYSISLVNKLFIFNFLKF